MHQLHLHKEVIRLAKLKCKIVIKYWFILNNIIFPNNIKLSLSTGIFLLVVIRAIGRSMVSMVGHWVIIWTILWVIKELRRHRGQIGNLWASIIKVHRVLNCCLFVNNIFTPEQGYWSQIEYIFRIQYIVALGLNLTW
jgi:ABC-type xylose transport system permease subunit